jgi:adenylosuccinate synthase
MPTELLDATGEELRKVGNEFGATTGRPRRCGWFDAVVVRYAVRVNGLTGLAITKLDVLDQFEKIALCTGYKIGNEVMTEFPGDLADLDGIEPVYEWHEGWKSSTQGARKLSDLPKQARTYLDRLVEVAECPAPYVSVGTRRDQIIGL